MEDNNSHKRYLILVVDDEIRISRMIRMNLEHDGYDVIEANTGQQALDMVRSRMPNLVILDVMMPGLDGFETLSILREISQVPVIMLTAKSEEEDRIRGLELGADDYVTKPFSPRELMSRVKAVLRRSEGAGSASGGNEDVIQVDERLKIDFGKRGRSGGMSTGMRRIMSGFISTICGRSLRRILPTLSIS